MLKDDMDEFFHTPAGKWDRKVNFTIAEAVEILRVPRATIAKVIHSGELKASKVGKHYIISRVSLFLFQKNCTVE